MTKRYNRELLTVDVAIMIFACFELTLGNGLKSKISRILLRILYRWTYSGREITISDSCHGSKLWTVRRTFHCIDVEIDDGAVKISVFFERCPGVFVHEITKHSSSVLQRRIEWVMSWKNQSSRHSKTGNEVKLKKPSTSLTCFHIMRFRVKLRTRFPSAIKSGVFTKCTGCPWTTANGTTGARRFRKIIKISPRGLYFSKALFEGFTFGPLVGGKFISVICTKFLLKLAVPRFLKLSHENLKHNFKLLHCKRSARGGVWVQGGGIGLPWKCFVCGPKKSRPREKSEQGKRQ